jgi:uncharacterized protein with GYD domain
LKRREAMSALPPKADIAEHDRNVRFVKRAEAFRQMAETFGVTVKDIYWTQGRYDIVIVIEAPDELSATALNLSLSALGNIRTESLRAFSSADMLKIVAKML